MNRSITRILHGGLTYLATVTLAFGMIRLVPGGPMDALQAKFARQVGSSSTARIASMMEEYTNVNPDAPIYVQYFDYVSSMLMGDMGVSTYYQEPVAAMIVESLPWTLLVMSISLSLIFIIGIVLGGFLAYFENSGADKVGSVVSIILNSTPYYVLAILLIFSLGYQFELFPTSGRMSNDATPGFTITFISDILYHAALPVLSMVITGFGSKALLMRGNSISILGEDYVRVAQLRGLSDTRIALRYVTRNAILPMYTHVMLSIAFLLSGSTILEEVFSYHGMGYYLYQAVIARDYPLMMGSFIVITLAVIVGIVIADLTYDKIDPRASNRGGASEVY